MVQRGARAGSGTRRRILRRGRELHGPVLPPGTGPAGAAERFARLAHEHASQVAERAGLGEGDWFLQVRTAPAVTVDRIGRRGSVEQIGGRWRVVLHRLALERPGDPEETAEVVEATLAELFGRALGLDPDDLWE